MRLQLQRFEEINIVYRSNRRYLRFRHARGNDRKIREDKAEAAENAHRKKNNTQDHSLQRGFSGSRCLKIRYFRLGIGDRRHGINGHRVFLKGRYLGLWLVFRRHGFRA